MLLHKGNFKLIIFFTFFIIGRNLIAQLSYFPFPETCDFIYTHDNGITYLSSVNGVFAFDGTGTPEKLFLQGLDYNNIQSSFYPGKANTLWFATYNRIVNYDLARGLTRTYQVVFNDRDTMHSDYYIFKSDTLRDIIWGKQDSKIFTFNTADKSSQLVCDSVHGFRILSTTVGDSDYLLSYYYTDQPAIARLKKHDTTCQSILRWKDWPKNRVAKDLCLVDSAHALIATNQGLFLGDIATATVTRIFPDELSGTVNSIGHLQQNTWIISPRNGNLITLQKDPYNLLFRIGSFPVPHDTIKANRIFTGKDNTVFFSVYDKGIYFFNPEKAKFRNWEVADIKQIANSTYTSVRLQHLCQELEMTSQGTPFVFQDTYHLKSPAPYKETHYLAQGRINKIMNPDSAQLYRYYKTADKIYASLHNTGLFEFTDQTWKRTPFPKGYEHKINFFYPVNDTLHIASINQEKIIFWDPSNPDSTTNVKIFSGDLYNIHQPAGTQYLYISTDQGLANLNIQTYAIEIVDKDLQQPCICLLPDTAGNIWYSSSSGLYQYDPVKDTTRQFHLSDGIYAGEYAKRRCERISSDSLLFFYNGGATLVRPSAIRPVVTTSKIYISGFRVNDIDHPYPDVLNYADHYTAHYSENTLSFEIASIDWSDPAHTDIQYKLEGYDNQWVKPGSNNAFVRYPRLPPGEYTLYVKGSNADGIWNEDAKRLRITIIPPFWMRWWFIALSITAMGIIVYWIFKSYYNRKLERKNHIIEKQNLLIEKQQAIENERTRIASEMHDDLGAGLTTIRYLSDKALIQAKDAEETKQIKRIAEHSNTLVRNMSEIIWAMNSRFDNTENLTGYLRRYASEFLSERHIPYAFESAGSGQTLNIGGEKRRNIFLVFKELLHNSVKHANAQSILIRVTVEENFEIEISERGGKGFDPELSYENGNGLFNSRKRLQAIDGELSFNKSADAMNIIITVPVNENQPG